jgi:hypothetical protein
MIKVFEDKKKAVEFDASIDSTINRCNELINIFHEFQPFKRIQTITDYELLAAAPGVLFDKLLIDNVQLKATGLTADPEQVATLFNIDRKNFMNLVAGRSVRIEDCQPCRRVGKIKPGQTAISLSEYLTYKPYMIFDEGEFIRNDAAADERKKDFTTYAVTPQQIAVVNHFSDLVKILNFHYDKYGIGSEKKIIARGLHLYLTEADSGSFMIDEIFIKDNINR